MIRQLSFGLVLIGLSVMKRSHKNSPTRVEEGLVLDFLASYYFIIPTLRVTLSALCFNLINGRFHDRVYLLVG